MIWKAYVVELIQGAWVLSLDHLTTWMIKVVAALGILFVFGR